MSLSIFPSAIGIVFWLIVVLSLAGPCFRGNKSALAFIAFATIAGLLFLAAHAEAISAIASAAH